MEERRGRMAEGGRRGEAGERRMQDGGGPWDKGEAGGMASSSPPVGSLLKHVQVQAGKVWGEFMG